MSDESTGIDFHADSDSDTPSNAGPVEGDLLFVINEILTKYGGAYVRNRWDSEIGNDTGR